VDGRQAIDAQRIREVEFRERMRGYHQEDVDDFLEQVARGVEELERQLGAAKEEIAALRARSAEAQPQASSGPSGDVIQRTLIVAQRAADQLREEAEREARELRAEAQRQAERILADARTTSRLIEEERRKNLMEELSELDTEIKRRQEQLATLLKRDKVVREKLAEELSGLLAALRTQAWDVDADRDPSEPLGEATAMTSTADGEGHAAPGGHGAALASQDPAVDGGAVTSREASPGADQAAKGESKGRGANRVEPTETGVAYEAGVLDLGPEDDDPTAPRAVQDFVFGHSIDEATEPFLLWRHDPEE